MPRSFVSPIKVFQPEGGFKVYINNVNYTNYAINYSFVEKDNQVKNFSVELVGTSASQRQADLLQQKVLRLESNNKLIFKGTIEKPEYNTGESVVVTGYGSGESILKNRVAEVTGSCDANSPENRPIYDGVEVNTILNEQISGITVQVHGTDNGTYFGKTSNRGDFASKMSFVDGMIRGKDGKWWFSHGTKSPWDPNILHVAPNRGSDSSVKTYYISGDSQNTNVVSNEQDWEKLWNDVDALGYGDGANQLRSHNSAVTDNKSPLAADIDGQDTTIEVEDASDLPVSGAVWIGMEWVQYTGKSGNTLTGCTRAPSTTNSGVEAYAHRKGIDVRDTTYSKDSPESGSSVDTYGIKFHAVQNKTIIKQDTLDNVAQNVLSDHKDIVTRIVLEPSDPYEAARDVNVGDVVTITDSDSETSGDFRIFSKEIFSEEGYERVRFECSNARDVLSTELEESKRLSDVQSRYMQGATNIFVVNETENADSNQPIDIFFEIPEEAVGINQVKLAYRNESPRIWHAITDPLTGTGSPVNNVVDASGATYSPSDANWSKLVDLPDPSTAHEQYNIMISVTQADLPSGGTTGTVYFRIHNNTDSEYYPSSNGVLVLCIQDVNHVMGDNSVVISVPKNLAGKDIDLDIKSSIFGSSEDWNVWYTVWCFAQHKHNIDYVVSGVAYTTTDMKVYTSDNTDGDVTWTERTSELETEYGTLDATQSGVMSGLDITKYFSSTGWKGIRLEPDGDSRHKANVLVKCMVDSKKV